MLLPLIQLRVLRLSLFQDGDVGVGVLPEGEEILVGNLCPGFISRQRVGAAKSEMRQCAYRRIHHNSPMVEDLLKCSGGFVSATRYEIGFPTHINGIERARRTEFVRRSSLKDFDGP